MEEISSNTGNKSSSGIARLLHQVLEKLGGIEQRIDNIEQKIENIEEKLYKLEYIEEEVYYTSNRFRFKPFLCDPSIKVDDLVLIQNHENKELEGCHRIVKSVSENYLVVIHSGQEVEIQQKDVEKVGHSPALKHLVIQDLVEQNIASKRKKN